MRAVRTLQPLTAAARLAALPCALLAALLCGCIERPWQDGPPPRTQVDRTALREFLLTAPPEGLVPVGARFGNAAELVGYRVDPPVLVPGQRTTVTLVWRCLAELEPWHVFVHLDDASGTGERIHAEHDPVGGRFPTDAWRPGDLIADPFSITAGRSPLHLFLGFYSQGESRLTLNSAGRGRDDGSNRLYAGTLAQAH